MLNDLRYAIRGLLRTPGFSIAVVLTLALGIGANTAIFQLIDAVAFRKLPVQNPDEIAEVRIAGTNKGFGVTPGPYSQLTRPIWEELQRSQQAFSGMFAWATPDLRVGPRENLRPASGLAVSSDFFRVLGVQPFRGRLLDSRDEAACPATRGVVSYQFWQREMSGRPLNADARLQVNLLPVDVVGVTPPDFFGLAVGERFDVALPLCRPAELRRELFDVAVMGRLRPGWTMERASAHVNTLSAGIFEATAPTGYRAERIDVFKRFQLGVYPAASGVSGLRTRYDDALRLLLAITGLILLLACANLANLMLARASARDREVAVRVAMGASRWLIIRQFIVESCVLAAASAVLAVVLAQGLSRVILWALSTQSSSPDLTVQTDWRVLFFTAAVAMTTCVFFALAPAVRAVRLDPAVATRAGGRGMTAGRERFSLQRLMVVTQIAISLVMLVAALLFVCSFRNLMTFDPGMRQEGITIGRIRFEESVAPERYVQLRRDVVAELKSLPGIVNAAATSQTPLLGGSWSHGIQVGETHANARFTWVSPGYFDTMGIRIIQGRDLTDQDTETSLRVAVVNLEFVRQFIGSGNAIGQRLTTGAEPRYPSTVYEIVGVIPNTQYNDLRGTPPPMVFAPDSQHPVFDRAGATVLIHSSVPPETAIAEMRQHMRQAHPGMVSEFSVFRSSIRDGMVRERLLAMLAGFFGVLAVLLTVIGLYGMLSFVVARRRPEIGVRIALGATRRQAMTLVMSEAGRLVLAGIAAGSALSVFGSRSASTLLFGLKPNDPLILGGACALLAVIAAVASFLPARRASRIDPAEMLREA